MASLGVNVARDGSSNPDTLRFAGARWVRVVAIGDADLRPWLAHIKRNGIKVLLVIVRESLQSNTPWGETVGFWAADYGDLVDAYQLMNEPDAGWDPVAQLSAAERAALTDDEGNPLHGSSWCMDPPEVSKRLREGREALGPDAYIVGPGLSSGHPEYADLVDWSPCNALAFHPYAKDPGSPELDWLTAAYKERADAA